MEITCECEAEEEEELFTLVGGRADSSADSDEDVVVVAPLNKYIN